MTSPSSDDDHFLPPEPIEQPDGLCDDEAAESGDLSAVLSQAVEPLALTVEARAHGWRLDHYLSRLFANHSRAQLQKGIEAGSIKLNGLATRPSRRLRVNDRIWVQLPDAEESHIPPEDIPLDVLFEDDYLVVLNKAANMIVHPGKGNYGGTLAGALQFHFNQLSDVAGRHRPGIVHRLDRDTSGVILVAKDNQIHQKLSSQFERREVKKEYRAIVRGVPELDSDYIRTHVCVHPRVREKMMVCPEGGNAREAVTFYKTGETFLNRFALMELHPATGRTHQLRIHMLHIGTPIVADKLYMGQSSFCKSQVLGDGKTDGAVSSSAGSDEDVLIARQALHAYRLTIRHPVSGKEVQFEAPFPPDFERTLHWLRSVG
ncbi:MAG: RluA family pseudouridine synthase [Planctomycetaceae bacterium]|nr:RluA family pseudouridine synthase [Planctomycetaceae bacterium]